MFRPNRIGTPNIFQVANNLNTADVTIAEYNPPATSNFGCNVINATPVADFGYSQLYQARSEAITAGYRWGLAQQFTITQPLSGDTIGLELIGALSLLIPSDAHFVPFLAKLSSAASAVMEGKTITGPLPIEKPEPPLSLGTVTTIPRSAYYRTQAVINNSSDVSGTYVHGFQMYCPTTFTNTWFAANFGVRQLNDQQSIGYRDTLR